MLRYKRLTTALAQFITPKGGMLPQQTILRGGHYESHPPHSLGTRLPH